MHHLTKSLAAEWAARGVRVNAVAPTYINTPMTAYATQNKAMFDTWMEFTPMAPDGRDGRDRVRRSVPRPGRVKPDEGLDCRGRRGLYLLVI